MRALGWLVALVFTASLGALLWTYLTPGNSSKGIVQNVAVVCALLSLSGMVALQYLAKGKAEK